MFSFKKLASAGVIATFLLITVGGLVRATRSGLGCGDDWPECSGRLLPDVANKAMMIEYSHRSIAAVVVVLLAALALQAFREKRPRSVKIASISALGLVVFQALLGAAVVFFHLHADLVVLHLATALSLLALLSYIAISVFEVGPAGDARSSRTAAIAAGSVFLLLLVGSYVSGEGAGYVFPDWPLMDGAIIPELDTAPRALHFLHRVLAAAVGIVVARAAFLIARNRDRAPLAAKLAHAAAGLFLVEVVIGAVNVLTDGNDAAVTAHLAVGAAIWGLLVATTLVAGRRTDEEAYAGETAEGVRSRAA